MCGPGPRACCSVGARSSESPGEARAAPRPPLRSEASEGPALPPVLLLYSPSCAAELIGWIWQNGLTAGSCRYCPVKHWEGFRGQDEVLLCRARRYCRDRAVLLAVVVERKESHCCFQLPLLCAYTVCRTYMRAALKTIYLKFSFILFSSSELASLWECF